MCGKQAAFMLKGYGLVEKVVDQVITVIATENAQPHALTYAVESKAKELGFVIGVTCDNEPRGLSRSANRIEKWRNINKEDYYKLDGVVMYMNDEAVIVLFR